MHDATFRRITYVILAVALALRVGYLAFGEVLPVMWDARRYAAAGVALISFVDSSGPGEAANEREDRYRFKHYYDKYIQGEKIEWLAYSPHTLTQAREELFFSGPLYPIVLAAVFFVSPVADFMVARGVGVLFDLLANLLLIAIGVRLVGRRGALIAGAVYAIYFPFIMASSMLLLETSTSLLILLAVYLMIRGTETNHRLSPALAGLVTGGLVLNKPTAMLLAAPFLLGFYFYTRGTWTKSAFLVRGLAFAVPLVAVFAGWFVVASVHYGQVTLRDPEYADANLRQSTSIPNAGYDLDIVEEGFWERSIAGDIVADPVGFAGLAVKKFDRLWRRPYNDFRRSFVIPYQANEVMHLIVVVFGLVGLLLLVRVDWGRAAWPVLIVLYYTGIHLVFHAISRYNFQAMPMMMLAFGYFVAVAGETYTERKDAGPVRLIGGLGLLVLGWLFDASWVNAVLGTGLSEGLVLLVLAVRVLLILGGLLLLFAPLARRFRLKGRVVPVAAAVVIGVVTVSNTLARDQWAEFACRLDSPQMKAGTRIYISDMEPAEQNEMLAVAVDVNSGAGRRNTFTMQIGDAVVPLMGGQRPLMDFFYPKPTYRFYSQLIPMGLEEYRQYAIIPVPDSMVQRFLQERGHLDISVAINDSIPEENNYITLWGQYETGDSVRYIPSWRHTSIERFVHQDDPRIPRPVNYLSDSTISYYIPRTSDDVGPGEDLAPAAGLQTGRYNIFLMHFKPDGSVDVY